MTNPRLISEYPLNEIGYHGVLAELPIHSVQAILNKKGKGLVECRDIMYLRPAAQGIVSNPVMKQAVIDAPPADLPSTNGPPVVALLDGLPIENHPWLRGRLIVDDPEGWSANSTSTHRIHGTAMASLILHGDLDAHEKPLTRSIYVRPILKPSLPTAAGHLIETTPEDILVVDLIHSAVKRILVGEGGEVAVAPTIRVINLSIGDMSRLYDRSISPLARLLDWLSEKYKVLFVVSAGNHDLNIDLDIPRVSLAECTPQQIEQATIRAMALQARERRLRVPAEAINVLTVGAAHEDESNPTYLGQQTDLLCTGGLPSPISPLGFGHRRSIKPEILASAGRQLYIDKPGTSHGKATFGISLVGSPPGQRVAAAGSSSIESSRTTFCRGTSNAAAIVTRSAARLYDTLENLRQDNLAKVALPEEYSAVMLKAMLVHSAGRNTMYGHLEQVLQKTVPEVRKPKEFAVRFMGYGKFDPNRVTACTDQRATLLGCGTLWADQSHLYDIPLPSSLRASKATRRLIVTLAWLSPIDPWRYSYRRADLWFSLKNDPLRLTRLNDMHLVQNGTVQHEVWEGHSATASRDNAIHLLVNCRPETKTSLDIDVVYGLVVTLEVTDNVDVSIYEEIRQRIQPTVRITSSNV
jgi:hypothetical protein